MNIALNTNVTRSFLLLILISCSFLATGQDKGDARPVAFPGAEGFGKYATGGRGGKVLIVTNLNDDGEGSLRHALMTKGPRIIVFAVSGTIHLKSRLNIPGNVTIAGQTAPGDGICIADYPVHLTGDNIIIRFIRLRMGDRYQNQGQTPGAGVDDALSGVGRKHIIIDHCSMSWSTDEVCSIYRGDSTTIQWSMIYEPLNYSYHFEEGDTDFEEHGFGGIWGGSHFSAHHNLFAHCNSRTPRFNGARLGAKDELVDFRYNVIYNWGKNSIYGGEGGRYNIVNNYFKYGPDTKSSVKYRIVNPSTPQQKHLSLGAFYVNGNIVDEAPQVSKNNWLGIHMDKAANQNDKRRAVVGQPFQVEPLPLKTAAEAYTSVLEKAGAFLPKRDTLDERIIRDVKNRTGRIIDVQGGYPHGTDYETSKSAWPVLKSAAVPLDTDKDGIPDDWELKNGLNPNDPADASMNTLHKYYTNIEVYINSLVPQY